MENDFAENLDPDELINDLLAHCRYSVTLILWCEAVKRKKLLLLFSASEKKCSRKILSYNLHEFLL